MARRGAGAAGVSLAIGLDVSELRMGWAVVDYDTQAPLALGVENLREKDGGYPEDQVLHAMRAIYTRLTHAYSEWRDEAVYVVGIEDVYRGPSIKGTIRQAGIVGMATMAARVVFGSSVVYWPIPNGTWLKPLGLDKTSQVKSAVVKAETLGWATAVLYNAGHQLDEGLEQDAADALGIATACAMLTVKKDAA